MTAARSLKPKDEPSAPTLALVKSSSTPAKSLARTAEAGASKTLGRKTAAPKEEAEARPGKTLGRGSRSPTPAADLLTRALVKRKISDRLAGRMTPAELATWARTQWEAVQRGARLPCALQQLQVQNGLRVRRIAHRQERRPRLHSGHGLFGQGVAAEYLDRAGVEVVRQQRIEALSIREEHQGGEHHHLRGIRQYFHRGTRYARPEVDDVRRAVREVLAERQELRRETLALRDELGRTWPMLADQVARELSRPQSARMAAIADTSTR